ncbi:MAG: hypothetical protein P4L81_06185, partial [Candidatus Pacebacteria bacterium]|nr:hypothetical protein [Candidatus Paceibacterota bacterium]
VCRVRDKRRGEIAINRQAKLAAIVWNKLAFSGLQYGQKRFLFHGVKISPSVSGHATRYREH